MTTRRFNLLELLIVAFVALLLPLLYVFEMRLELEWLDQQWSRALGEPPEILEKVGELDTRFRECRGEAGEEGTREVECPSSGEVREVLEEGEEVFADRADEARQALERLDDRLLIGLGMGALRSAIRESLELDAELADEAAEVFAEGRPYAPEPGKLTEVNRSSSRVDSRIEAYGVMLRVDVGEGDG